MMFDGGESTFVGCRTTEREWRWMGTDVVMVLMFMVWMVQGRFNGLVGWMYTCCFFNVNGIYLLMLPF